MRSTLPAVPCLIAIGALYAQPSIAQSVVPPPAPPVDAQEGPSSSEGSPPPVSPPNGADLEAMDADALFRQVFGKERPPLAAGSYSVIVDQVNVGEYEVTPGTGDDGTVATALLRAALIPVALNETAGRLKDLAQRPVVHFSELRNLGFTVDFDPGQLVLRIAIPSDQRTARELLLRGTRRRANLEYVPQADVSAYISARAGIDLIEDSTTRGKGFSGFASDIDLGANVLGLAAQARFRYDERRDKKFSRRDVRLTYDDLENLIRFEAGDLSVARRPYQLAPRIGGVAVFREFPIDPYRNIRPTAEQGFQLDEPARVEVILNGAPVRTFTLGAGRYNLRDLPLVPSAANDIELRITYASGRTEILLFPAFYDIELLEPGLVDFAVNVGFPYRDENGKRTYDDGNYNVLAYIRKGLTPTLTAGLNWEGDEGFDTVGAEVIWASPLGSLAINAATNVRKPSLGSSRASLQYAWRDADPVRGRAIDAQIILTGRDYRTLNQLFGSSIVRVAAQARIGQMISPVMRAQLYGGYDDAREFGERYYFGGSLSRQFGFGSLSVGAEYQRDAEEKGFVVRASLSMPIGKGTASASYTSEDNAARIEYNRLAALGVGAIGFSAGAERRDDYDRQYARLNYIGNRFEAGVEQVRAASDGGQRELHTGFTFGTSLVMADGTFAVGRPISNSFAIVSVDERAADYRIAVEPRRGFGSTRTLYSAYSDALGPAVVPSLPPYFNRTLEVDAPDAPAGTSLGGQVFAIRPGYRSGYRLKVGSGSNVSAVGTLVGRGNEPLAFVTGEARRVGAESSERSLQLFTNAGGRFFLEGAMAGETYELTIRVKDTTLETVLIIPPDIVGIYRIEDPIAFDVAARPEGSSQ